MAIERVEREREREREIDIMKMTELRKHEPDMKCDGTKQSQ